MCYICTYARLFKVNEDVFLSKIFMKGLDRKSESLKIISILLPKSAS